MKRLIEKSRAHLLSDLHFADAAGLRAHAGRDGRLFAGPDDVGRVQHQLVEPLAHLL